MKRAACWGVYRELAHSPGRETDDAEILRATAAELSAAGFDVTLKSPDELLSAPTEDVPPFLFVMCERPEVVERLAVCERRGARIVNRPWGIRNTDRERTIALFAAASVPFPRSVLVDTARAADYPGTCWVKRGDVHATEAGDVAYAADPGTLALHLERLSERGIARAVVQDHVPGDQIKFYGVASVSGGGRVRDAADQPSWFQWFYHRDQTLSNHAFDQRELIHATSRAASALGLEVYGGDAIVSKDGGISIIDVNAWPSFALFRAVAASRIAALLAARFTRAPLSIEASP
jgi:glutathione synthase/RimK-type ligase-like ATP-grasp enzyme